MSEGLIDGVEADKHSPFQPTGMGNGNEVDDDDDDDDFIFFQTPNPLPSSPPLWAVTARAPNWRFKTSM